MVQETKSDFHKKLDAQLLVIEEKLERIEEESAPAGDFRNIISRLNQARAALDALAAAPDSLWGDRRFELEDMVNELNEDVKKALESRGSSD